MTAPTAPVTARGTAAAGSDGRFAEFGAWAYVGGELVRFEDANVSIATHAFNYGTAIFEGIRAYQQDGGGLAILFGPEHYERMLRNGRMLRAQVGESVGDLVDATRELLRRNAQEADIYIRPILYKSAPTIRLQLSGLDDRVAIFSHPMGGYVKTEGLRVTVSAWQRINDNAIPARGKVTGGYVNACLAIEDAKAAGYDEAIMLTADGHVAEASSSNLFVVRGREVATPPLTDDVLGGITRSAVLTLARDAGYDVVERKIDRTELYTCDELFLTGTGVQVAAVSSVDERPIGDGASFPVVADIQTRYFDAVRGRGDRYRDWLTPV